MKYHFASDNTSGHCPEAWAAMEEAGRDYAASYGEDRWTAEAAELFRETFGTRECEVFFVFNGTAANSLALASLCRSYHSIVTHERAHIETDECGAPEFYSNGTKILLTPGAEGKLDAGEVERMVTRRRDIHFPKPKVISLSQSTELGTVYTAAEVREIGAVARRHGLRLHMDGARFSNAAAALGVEPAEFTWKAGVDVLCLGGTKAGIGMGEAVVFFDRGLAEEFDYRCKQAGQLASKMRFIAAPWVAMLRDGRWLERAAHANAMARRLEAGLAEVPGARVLRPAAANAVFVEFPEETLGRLKAAGWVFYNFIGGGGSRLMCSWRTTEAEVAEFLADCAERR